MTAPKRLPPWHEHFRLPSGRELLIRPIRPEDAGPIQGAFGLLGPEEIRHRFMYALKELTPEMAQRLTHPDPNTEFALVAAEALPPGEALVGAVARVALVSRTRDAEFAILVSHFSAGQGLGRHLMRKLAKWARSKKLDRLYGDVLDTNQPMLAPYWADVDTGSGPLPGGGNQVWVMSPNENTLVVTWDRVGYFSENTSKVNTFQLALYKTDSNGSFDAEFRYQQLQWTTGDASDGFAGLGGVRAQAGWDAGDGRNWQVLDGSLTDDVLNLVNTTNVLGGEKGLFRFSFNAGQLPGSTASNPILPVFDPDEVEAGWDFTFNVTAVDQMIFIDPDVATGYTYTIETPDQFFTSVLLPEGLGDGLYTIEVWDGTQYVTEVLNAEGGTVYSFGSAVTLFRVTGIEPEANLDPTDPYAFVTGLTFASTGTTSMSQIPIITSITAPVPEPETLALVVAGLFVVWRCQGRHSHCLVP